LQNASFSRESNTDGSCSLQKQKSSVEIKGACILFAVPNSTLLDRLQGINPRSETRADGHKLTVIEEEVLVKQLLDTDKRGFPIRPEYLRGLAHTYFAS
jgi:hypothetical protein